MDDQNKRTPFKWTAQKERAATLLAGGRLKMIEIASELDVTTRCVEKWRERPEFRQRVQQIAAQFERSYKDYAIGDVTARVAAKNRRWQAFEQIMSERGEAYGAIEDGSVTTSGEVQIEPGMSTGLMTKVITETVEEGANSVRRSTRTEFKPDYQISAAMTALEDSAAKDLGQGGASKIELSGRVQITDEPDLSGLSDAELTIFEALLAKYG